MTNGKNLKLNKGNLVEHLQAKISDFTNELADNSIAKLRF